MRYELRRWNDMDHTDYTIKMSSDDVETLKAMLKNPSISNGEWYRLHIVDTQDTLND